MSPPFKNKKKNKKKQKKTEISLFYSVLLIFGFFLVFYHASLIQKSNKVQNEKFNEDNRFEILLKETKNTYFMSTGSEAFTTPILAVSPFGQSSF